MAASVAVVIPSWNGRDLLRRALASLEAQPTGVDIVVVDNGSTDGTATWLAEDYPRVQVLRNPSNRGYAAAVNQGIRVTRSTWVALLNNDAVAAPRWLAELLSVGERDTRIGAVASRMMFAAHPGVVSSAGIRVDPSGGAWDLLVGQRTWPSEPLGVFGASGGACLLRRAMLDDVGLFQEDFFAYLEDVDLAWRARARGWRAVLAPSAVVYHAVSATAGEQSPFKRYYLARNKWRVIARNYPARGLIENVAAIVAYDLLSLANALRRGDPVPLRGRLDTWRDLPRLLHQRARVQRRSHVDWPELRRALAPLERPDVLFRRARLVTRLAQPQPWTGP